MAGQVLLVVGAALACSRIRSFSLSVSLSLARWMSPSVSRARSACFGVNPARLLGVVRPWFGVLVRIFGVEKHRVYMRRSTTLNTVTTATTVSVALLVLSPSRVYSTR